MKIIGQVNGAIGKIKSVRVERGHKAYAVIAWENVKKGQKKEETTELGYLLRLEKSGGIRFICT